MARLVLIQSDSWECVVIDTQGLSDKKLLEEYGDDYCKVVQVIELPDSLSTKWPADRELQPLL